MYIQGEIDKIEDLQIYVQELRDTKTQNFAVMNDVIIENLKRIRQKKINILTYLNLTNEKT